MMFLTGHKAHEAKGRELATEALDDDKILATEWKTSFIPDYTSYFLFVSAQRQALESMWAAQVAKAQWKAPCCAQGKMECQSGHKIKMNPAIICDAQIKDEKGKTVSCAGQWYWVDGPEGFSMCNGKCEVVKKMDPGLKCLICRADLLCSIRTTDYYP